MLARIAQVEAESEQPPVLSPAIEAIVERYQNGRVSEVRMRVIRPFLRAVMAASGMTGEESARKHVAHVTELADYALRRGVSLQVSAVLTTDLIDEFIRVGQVHTSSSVRKERRRRLLALASNVNPGPQTPTKLEPLPYQAIRPCYTPDEVAMIRRVAWTQPTAARRRDLLTVAGLSIGAGLDSQDYRSLRVEHITDDPSTGITVKVTGPRPRVVVLRRGWEEEVRAAVAERRPGQLALGRVEGRHNVVAPVLERAAGYQLPDLDVSRLRATWLADLMTDPVPLAVILNAAGLRSARSLADLLPHLDPWMAFKGLSAGGAA